MTPQEEWLMIDGLDEAIETWAIDPIQQVTWLGLSRLLPPDDGLPHIWYTQHWQIEVFPHGKGLTSSRRLKITPLEVKEEGEVSR